MKHMTIPFLLTFTLTFSGCLGSPAPQDHYYRLELSQAEAPFTTPPLHGTLQVTRPWADALTSERHLLYRQNTGTSQVHRHAYHRWIDSPTLILQQQMADYLRSSRVARQVVTPEHRVKADYRFTCRVVKLERVLDNDPRVVMELELGLTHMRDREAVLLQTYHVEQPANNHDIATSIVAYNQALTTILNQFLGDASTLPEAIRIKHTH